ncbi:MAG: hypothetical protein ACYTEL_20725 [Planctomycetota bacterium]|jgi:hypothetical protein
MFRQMLFVISLVLVTALDAGAADTSAGCVAVDDFESYDRYDNRIYYWWDDGIINWSAACIDLGMDPCDPVHAGSQSMLYIYDNSLNWGVGYYSVADLPFASPQDWTAQGVPVLSLWFYGSPGNDAGWTEQMYVALEDNSGYGSYTEVRYGDHGEDMDDIKVAQWQQWTVDLNDFHQAGVDLTAVTWFHIGFGDGTNYTVPGGYGIVWFDDIELCRPPIEVFMKFTPQALNPNSKGNWMKAHFVFPEGFDVEDVDANTPAVVEPGGIESDYMNVFVNEDGFVEIEAAFDRAQFCGIVTGDEPIEVTVVCSFTDGQCFSGTDIIKITTNNIEYLAALSLHWLDECQKPDWCNGLDFDQDSAVDFADFALFDGCCIEVFRD